MNNKVFNKEYQKPIRRSLRKTMPKGEIILWTKIKDRKLDYKFRRQQGIGKYVVDFYCPKLKLAIEVDGKTHDWPDQIIYDKERQKYIESLGIEVKRFYSQDVFEDIDYVIDQIRCLCEKLDNK